MNYRKNPPRTNSDIRREEVRRARQKAKVEINQRLTENLPNGLDIQAEQAEETARQQALEEQREREEDALNVAFEKDARIMSIRADTKHALEDDLGFLSLDDERAYYNAQWLVPDDGRDIFGELRVELNLKPKNGTGQNQPVPPTNLNNDQL